MNIIDRYGKRRNWSWLFKNYGAISVEDGQLNGEFKVVELREVGDLSRSARATTTLTCTMVDEGGKPLVGQDVAFYWPDAPSEPMSGGLFRAILGTTDENGVASFAMGRGAYYNPTDEKGPHACWPWGQDGPVVNGLGMIAGTNHDHVNVVMAKRATRPVPPPLPGPGPVLEPNVERAIEALGFALAKIRLALAELSRVRRDPPIMPPE